MVLAVEAAEAEVMAGFRHWIESGHVRRTWIFLVRRIEPRRGRWTWHDLVF